MSNDDVPLAKSRKMERETNCFCEKAKISYQNGRVKQCPNCHRFYMAVLREDPSKKKFEFLVRKNFNLNGQRLIMEEEIGFLNHIIIFAKLLEEG